MQTFEIDNAMFWKNSFTSLLTKERLTQFIVLDIENIDTNMNESRAAIKQKFRQVRVQVARMSDFGADNATFWVNTHLGELITYNDCVLGYDLEQINNETLDQVKQSYPLLPDVILIKKYFPKYRKNLSRQRRNWKLKHLTKEE